MPRNHDLQRRLANALVLTLPSFDRWTSSIWNADTPYGRVGHRQVQILYRLRYPEYMNGMPPTASNLAEVFSIRKSVMTRVLASLEVSGFVRRVEIPADRRSHLIELTETGIAVSVYIEDIFVREMEASIGFMTDRELEHVLAVIPLLNTISDRLELARKERSIHDDQDLGIGDTVAVV